MSEPIEIRITLVLKLSGDSWIVEAMADQTKLSNGLGCCEFCDWHSASDVQANQWRGLAQHMRQIHTAEWHTILVNGGFRAYKKQRLRLSV